MHLPGARSKGCLKRPPFPHPHRSGSRLRTTSPRVGCDDPRHYSPKRSVRDVLGTQVAAGIATLYYCLPGSKSKPSTLQYAWRSGMYGTPVCSAVRVAASCTSHMPSRCVTITTGSAGKPLAALRLAHCPASSAHVSTNPLRAHAICQGYRRRSSCGEGSRVRSLYRAVPLVDHVDVPRGRPAG